MTVTIRVGVTSDAEALAELAAQTFAETFGPDNTADDLAAYLAANFKVESFIEELADPACRYLIAEIVADMVGYAKLRWGDPPAYVRGTRPAELARIYVSADWLGRGVGQALMQRCIDDARESGSQSIWLGVWERNSRAQAFYLRWGFRKVGEHIFVLGSDPQTDWVMERDL